MIDLIIGAYNTILYQPLYNFLILLYQYLPGHDFGFAVIVLTILIRLILYPLMAQSLKSQKILSDLQPKIKEIQERFKNDKQKQAKEIFSLYQKEKINPFSSFLSILVQFPILIALYQVFWKGLNPETINHLYSFIPNPGQIDPTFLGVINLAQSSAIKIDNIQHYIWPNVLLIILVGVTQFIQTKLLMPKSRESLKKQDQTSQFSSMLQKQMLYFFPVFIIFILWNLPTALSLYLVITNLFSIGQQYLILKPKPNYAQPN